MGKIKDWLVKKKIKSLFKKVRKEQTNNDEMTAEDKTKMIEALKHITELYEIIEDDGTPLEKYEVEQLSEEKLLELFKTAMKTMEKDL